MCLCGPINSIPEPFNHESITVSTSAVGLTASAYKPTDTAQGDPQPAVMAFITNFGAIVRYWFDSGGVAPTSTVGHVLADGDSITICQASLNRFKAIRKDSTDSVLSVTYLRLG